MKSIRIGNDIHVRWRVMRSGVPEDFNGKEVKVCLTDYFGGKYYPELELTSDGTIEFTFYGREQKKPGTYFLTLSENSGKDGMVTVDRTEVFKLVARQNSVVANGNGGCCCNNDLDIETVDITTDLMIPALGHGVVKLNNIDGKMWGKGLETKNDTVNVKISSDAPNLVFGKDGGLRCDIEELNIEEINDMFELQHSGGIGGH